MRQTRDAFRWSLTPLAFLFVWPLLDNLESIYKTFVNYLVTTPT